MGRFYMPSSLPLAWDWNAFVRDDLRHLGIAPNLNWGAHPLNIAAHIVNVAVAPSTRVIIENDNEVWLSTI